jgi:SAM-dependent methyltransferase
MSIAPERELSARSIIDGQKESFREIEKKDFCPNEVGRTEYLLPSLVSSLSLFQREISAETAIRKFIKSRGRCVVLDLGCGAGFWLANKNEEHGKSFEGYGVSASDYRKPEQRQPLIVEEREENGEKRRFLRSIDSLSVYFGYLYLLEEARVDDAHYFQGDIHGLLRQFTEEKFDVIVSHQTCRYLFDPLRALKGVYRVLKKGGFAFLESLKPIIFDSDDKQLSFEQIGELFNKNGYKVFIGKYWPDPDHIREGLSFKKDKKSRLSLPDIIYRGIIPNPYAHNSLVVTYQLKS